MVYRPWYPNAALCHVEILRHVQDDNPSITIEWAESQLPCQVVEQIEVGREDCRGRLVGQSLDQVLESRQEVGMALVASRDQLGMVVVESQVSLQDQEALGRPTCPVVEEKAVCPDRQGLLLRVSVYYGVAQLASTHHRRVEMGQEDQEMEDRPDDLV